MQAKDMMCVLLSAIDSSDLNGKQMYPHTFRHTGKAFTVGAENAKHVWPKAIKGFLQETD